MIKRDPDLAPMAIHDLLPGVPNRWLFEHRLTTALARAERDGKKLFAVLLDLDHFKELNDLLGHHVGDQLLQSVADRLRRSVRKSDTVARLAGKLVYPSSGDEFLILLPGIAQGRRGGTVTPRILRAFREPFVLGEIRFRITASIGFAVYPDHGTDASTLLLNAHIAMYRAKQKGGDTCEGFTPIIQAELVQQLAPHGQPRRKKRSILR